MAIKQDREIPGGLSINTKENFSIYNRDIGPPTAPAEKQTLFDIDPESQPQLDTANFGKSPVNIEEPVNKLGPLKEMLKDLNQLETIDESDQKLRSYIE